MKILLTCHYTLPHYGGVEITVDKLAQSLDKKGHSVIIISGRAGGIAYERVNNIEIVRVYCINLLSAFGAHYPLFSPNLIPSLINAVRKTEIVHAHGMLYQNCLLALWLSRKAGLPSILTDHGSVVPFKRIVFDMAKHIVVQSLGRIALSLSDIVIVHDDETRKIVASLMRSRSDRLIQIPLGIDTNIFQPVPLTVKKALRQKLGWDERPKILFVGNFTARKRLDLLLDAADKRFDIVLCGEGTLPLAKENNLLVYPALPHHKLVELYQASDLFVVPSKVETFCLVAYEAMACGLPVIMTHDLSHLTIAQSGLVTFVSPTPQDLRNAILELLSDEGRRWELGQRGANWVHENFSWERCVDQHLRLYEQLISERGRRK